MLADSTDESVHSAHVGLLHLSLDHHINILSNPEPAIHIGAMSCIAKAMMSNIVKTLSFSTFAVCLKL